MDIGVYDDYDNYEEVEFIAKSDKRYIVLVIYDIVAKRETAWSNAWKDMESVCRSRHLRRICPRRNMNS